MRRSRLLKISHVTVFLYTPSSMKIGELSHRIFSFIKEKFSSIAALRFKILTKIKGKKHGSKFGFHTGWSILKTWGSKVELSHKGQTC